MSKTTFQVEIVTPTEVKYTGEVALLQLPGEVGEMGIMAGHAPLFALLAPGVLTYREEGTDHSMVIGRGFVQVAENRATCLVDQAELPEEIDREAARRDLEEAERRLESGEGGLAEQDRLRQQIRLYRSRVRLGRG